MTGPVTRIAMWCRPRAVSTALMRSFGNRPDTVVADEPLYAFYLARSGKQHPGREQILASQPTDWRVVIGDLANRPLPPGKSVFFAKHMAHHLLPEVDAGALRPFRHAYLIRDPEDLLASYAKVRATPDEDDLGIRQQAEIFEAFGGPVIDSGDLLAAPAGMLRALCSALGLPFTPAMLSWPPGPRETDGVWGPHWYEHVWRSTGFGQVSQRSRPLPPHLAELARRCRPFDERLRAYRLRPAAGSGGPTQRRGADRAPDL